MAINYIGPKKLKDFFKIAYKKIASNYERNTPKIVVNKPQSVLNVEPKEKIEGFTPQHFLNGYINRRMLRLNDIFKQIQTHGATKDLEKQYYKIMGELKKTSFVLSEDDSHSLGYYHPGDDAVFMDPYLTILYILNMRDLQDKYNPFVDVPSILSHELVHFDCGECLPSIEIRKHYQKAICFVENGIRAMKAVKKGFKAFKKWRWEKDGQTFLEKLPGGFKDIYEATEHTTKSELDKMEDVKKNVEELNIDVVEEALAYIFGGGWRGEFKNWLNKEKKDSPDALHKATQIYETLEQRLTTQGKLQTLREVKERINTSWKDRTNILTLF